MLSIFSSFFVILQPVLEHGFLVAWVWRYLICYEITYQEETETQKWRARISFPAPLSKPAPAWVTVSAARLPPAWLVFQIDPFTSTRNRICNWCSQLYNRKCYVLCRGCPKCTDNNHKTTTTYPASEFEPNIWELHQTFNHKNNHVLQRNRLNKMGVFVSVQATQRKHVSRVMIEFRPF